MASLPACLPPWTAPPTTRAYAASAPSGIPEPLLLEQLDVVSPANAAVLLAELRRGGQLRATAAPAAAAVGPPSLLLGGRAAAARVGSGVVEEVLHYFPRLGGCYVAAEGVVPAVFVGYM